MKQKGFSLIEFMIIVAIVAILIAIVTGPHDKVEDQPSSTSPSTTIRITGE